MHLSRFSIPISRFSGRWRPGIAALLAIAIALHGGPVLAFSFQDVAAKARALAQKPYKKPAVDLPAALKSLNPQQYREIRLKAERRWWHGDKLPFELDLVHQGDVYASPVRVHEIADGKAREVRFDPAWFDYGNNQLDPKSLAKLHFAGLRIHYAASGARKEERLEFLGASYFRGRGKNHPYGTFARGLAIDTAHNGGEKFPQFTEFWIERPAEGERDLTLYALLDSTHATGAYRFTFKAGGETQVAVKAQVYLRENVAKLGLAPLTSMFYTGENQAKPADDYRPEVHDADGLSILADNGEWIWRPLVNPKRLLVTSFALNNPQGFGLLQRDRRFSSYEDLDARYDTRPSLWVEPVGKWGEGRVELVQIPTPNELNDNIVAFWIPNALPKPGQAIDIEYRLIWSRDEDKIAGGKRPQLRVMQTRFGSAQRNRPENSLAFQVDFDGKSEGPVEVSASADGNGKILSANAVQNEVTGGWRMQLQMQRNDGNKPVELRAALRKGDATVSETWSYILPPS